MDPTTLPRKSNVKSKQKLKKAKRLEQVHRDELARAYGAVNSLPKK